MLAQIDPPLFADKGFLYVKRATTDAHGNTVPVNAGTNWTAVYAEIDGVGYFALRYPDPRVQPQESVTVDQVLSAAGRTTEGGLGRIRGR